MESDNGKTREKDCTFHHTVEMKQSHSMTEPARLILPGAFHRGCPATEFFMLRTVISGLGVPVLLLGMVFCLGDELIWLQELLQFLLLSRDSFRISKPAVAKLFPREWYLPKFPRRGAALRRVMGRRSLRPRCAGYRPAGASCGQVSERRRIARDSLSAGARGILPMRGYLSCRWRTCCADTL